MLPADTLLNLGKAEGSMDAGNVSIYHRVATANLTDTTPCSLR